jgi:YjjI family glycine radical enzyme
MDSDAIRTIVDDPTLTYRQRIQALAIAAENTLAPPPVSDACRQAMDQRIVCDMYEGNAPHRPRYTLPDYELAMRQGSEFLELPPPTTFDDALTFLLAMYANVPSITGYPVWFGDLDRLLEPFVTAEADRLDDAELFARLRRFWVLLDRLFPDAFAHANLGPNDGRVVRTALAVQRDVHQVVPNLTLRYDPTVTPDDLLLDAMRTVVTVAQPHVVHHPMMVADLGERYGVVSCYNSLPVGGGAHTLVRVNLRDVARRHVLDAADRDIDHFIDHFIDHTLHHYAALTSELIAARIRSLVEGAKFFDHSWLVREGLLHLDRCTAMFGIVGLAECASILCDAEGHPGRYGHDDHADELAHRIVAALAEQVHHTPMPYCEGTGGHALLHSQAGLERDVDLTVGTRIPPGDEPDVYRLVAAVAPNHRHVPSGISDIIRLDETVVDNPQAAADITRGALAAGMRDVTFDVANGEFVRITGYLARRRDIEHVLDGDGVRHSSTVLGAGAFVNAHLDQRRPQDGRPTISTPSRVRSHELDAGSRR